MKKTLEKLKLVEQELAGKHGPFTLFAYVLPADAELERWDLLVAGPWVESPNRDIIREIVESLQRYFTLEEMILLGAVVPITRPNPGLDAMHEEVQVEHGLVEIRDFQFYQVDIAKGYVITSQRVASEPAMAA